ncbi:DNA polymerase III subunit delta [Celerinatantimonas diazotrophica]|uniref:DNA polymerase III subunit delta n=1 Tax=Celerinatantimonas diazotrophica TaxID=412034 RepID=A0A4V2PRF9_9GAMM|nr:DNA polymerase III subunit delta [Celerinatantimonas diazotrophica]TCK58641.1 DNA polymerase III delta subunit [Celerinatantimonas diazotrophica]CAG9297270.1 DNA polymerase III subunit delta [Celerinatantimonas diazotrophica]
MKVYPEQLAGQLKQVVPAYLVCGDDSLLSQEAAQTIRQHVLAAGNVERLSFLYDSDFQWEHIFSQVQELSLFSPLKLLEIHFEKSLDKTAQQQLNELSNILHQDICLLLMTPALKKNQLQQNWARWVDQYGLIVQTNTPQGQQLKRWIKNRLDGYQLCPCNELSELLFSYYEGNLLALNQVIEQLHLVYPDGQTSVEQVEQTLINSGQFTQYQLVDTLLMGDINRAEQIARQINQQGDELTLFNWLLDKDLQAIEKIKQGHPAALIFKHYKIWNKRQPLLLKAAQNLNISQIQSARWQLATLDKAIKDVHHSDSWNQFVALLLIFLSPTWSPRSA